MDRRTGVRIASLAFIGMTGLLALRAVGLGGRQEHRPGFYAQKVLDHINVVAAGNALGAPDGRVAEIRPGGEMTVHMEQRIHYLEGQDDGAVVIKGDGQYGLAGLIKMSEEENFAWQPLVPGRSPGGFKLSTDPFVAPQTTDTIRIVNDGTRPIFVDAVIGFKREQPER